MVQVIVAVFVVGLILTPFADDDDADEVVQQGATMIEGHSTTTAAITARVTTRPTEASGKFDQTWEKKYDETSCTEWRADMTENERRMAAADMLTGGRSVDGTNELPSDRVIADFQRNVSTACEADGRQTIADMATGVFLIDKAPWQE